MKQTSVKNNVSYKAYTIPLQRDLAAKHETQNDDIFRPRTETTIEENSMLLNYHSAFNVY